MFIVEIPREIMLNAAKITNNAHSIKKRSFSKKRKVYGKEKYVRDIELESCFVFKFASLFEYIN